MTTITHRLASVLLAASVAVAYVAATPSALAAKPKKKGRQPQRSLALFHTFDYVGEDSVYTRHPLPTPQSFYNPVLPGWYSDPSVCTNGRGDYYLVTSTFAYYPGVPIFYSRDLINWIQLGHVLSRPSQLEHLKGQHVSGGIFAPAISYNPRNKTYYMITTDVGKGTFVVKTTDPAGEWSDPIWLPSVGGIDPSFFFDDDGRAWVVNNDIAPDDQPQYDGHRTIRLQQYDVETDEMIGPRHIIVNKGSQPEKRPVWIEGPHLYKIDGRYLLLCAEGGTSSQHSEVAFTAERPEGPYTPYAGNPVLTQRHLDASRPDAVTCTGHADLVKGPDGQWWSFFLGCRPNQAGFENLGRETFMMPVRWSAEGVPYITRDREQVPVVQYMPGAVVGKHPTFGNATRQTYFMSDNLDAEWLTLRGDAHEWVRLDSVPSCMALIPAPTTVADKDVPAYVGRRLQHHQFAARTTMTFTPAAEGEAAGLLLFKDESHHYFFGLHRVGRAVMLALWKSGPEGAKEVLAETQVDYKGQPAELTVRSNGVTFAFVYNDPATGEATELIGGVPADFLSTAVAGGFTGTTVGMYATSKQ